MIVQDWHKLTESAKYSLENAPSNNSVTGTPSSHFVTHLNHSAFSRIHSIWSYNVRTATLINSGEIKQLTTYLIMKLSQLFVSCFAVEYTINMNVVVLKGIKLNEKLVKALHKYDIDGNHHH